MPFGLTNAPAAFQRFINDIFSDLLDISVIVYLDDVLIFSDNEEIHKEHIKEVFRRLRQNGLFVNPNKCEFNVDTCEYLGYILAPDGLRMDQKKVQTILDWPIPRKVKDIQAFLGFCNFYRRFIDHYSDIVVPLTRSAYPNSGFDTTDDPDSTNDILPKAMRIVRLPHAK